MDNWYKSSDEWFIENVKDKVHVFDNIIDVDYQNRIKHLLISGESSFPWYFTDDVTAAGDYGNQKRCAFSHQFVDPETGVSQYNSFFIEMIRQSCLKVKKDKIKVIQGRSFFQLPQRIENANEPDSAHTDLTYPHFVVLYYVCDSDGDTIIYNEKASKRSFKDYTIKEKVTPKQGRVVVFDGSFYHTAEQPINNKRCIVNYDVI